MSVTTLSNGLTVVSEDACLTSTVIMTYPKAGSAGEGLDNQGAALMNKAMNFKSGSGLSTILINRTIEDEGGVLFTNLDRTGASLGYTVAPESAVGLVPLLATDCSFEKWDVRDAVALAKTEAIVAGESAQITLTENLFAAAYGPQSPAGRPLYTTGTPLDKVKAFRSSAYGLNGAILTATGIKDHSAFCTEAESLLADSPAGSADSAPTMSYIGGESRVNVPFAGYAHVALAFAAPGSSAVAGVVKQLFNVLGGESGVSGFSATGLVGLYGGSDSPSSLVDAMTGTVKATISPDVVKRAKSMAKAEALLALDDGSQSLAAAMTAAVMEGSAFSGPADVAKAYDAVTDAQVKEALAAMLKANPCIAAVGDIAAVPYHGTVAAKLS